MSTQKNLITSLSLTGNYLKMRFKIRDLKDKDTLVGCRHSSDNKPHIEKILKIFREQGKKRLGLELPVDFKNNGWSSIPFFSDLAISAAKLGFQVCNLDIPLDSELYVTTIASSHLTDILPQLDFDKEGTIRQIKHMLDTQVYDYEFLSSFLSGSRRADIPPELFGDKGYPRSAEQIIDWTKTTQRHIAILQRTVALAQTRNSNELCAIFLETVFHRNVFMYNQTILTKPDLIILGDAHSMALASILPSYTYLST